MKLIKQAVKKWLAVAGYQVIKTPPRSVEGIGASDTTGWIVELLGPPGVGKTTLVNSLPSELLSRWFTREQVEDLLRGRKANDGKGFSAFSLLHQEGEEIISTLLCEQYGHVHSRKDISLAIRSALYEYYVGQMEADVYCRYANLPKGVLSDEGVVHHFAGCIVARAHRASDGDTFPGEGVRDLFRKRALVSIQASPEFVIRNRRKRISGDPAKEKRLLACYGGESGMESLVAKNLERNEQVIAVATTSGANVLVVDGERGLKHNCETLSAFMEAVIKGDM